PGGAGAFVAADGVAVDTALIAEEFAAMGDEGGVLILLGELLGDPSLHRVGVELGGVAGGVAGLGRDVVAGEAGLRSVGGGGLDVAGGLLLVFEPGGEVFLAEG